jgi:hypothetical protein
MKLRMQKRILQTGILSIFVLVLFVACLRTTCGCSPAPLVSLTLSSDAKSVARGSNTQISIKADFVYAETVWPLQIVVKPSQEPQTGNLPLGVTVDSLVLTKDIPNGVLTLSVSKSATPGDYALVIYPTSSAPYGYLPYYNFKLTITD